MKIVVSVHVSPNYIFFYWLLVVSLAILLRQLFSVEPAGGRCLQGNRLFSPPASMTSHLVSVTFTMASKVFIEEMDKNFEFITELTVLIFLDLEILRFLMS